MRCQPSLGLPIDTVCVGHKAHLPHTPVTQLWLLNVAGHGGRLSSAVPFRRFPHQQMLQALSSPDAKTITALLLRRQELSVIRFDVGRGKPAGVPYRTPSLHDLWYVSLAADSSGRYLILDEGLGTVFGWIHNGRWHPFAHHDVIVSSAAW